MEYEPNNLEQVPMREPTENIMDDHSFPQNVSLAMAYVPYQTFTNLYDDETAFNRGTIFKALDLPFLGGKGVKK